jgi:hypothetical protein
MQPHLTRQASTGRSGVAAIGVAQEFRRVTCYYFYLWDQDFGPAFIKVCAYFPYPA